MRDGGQPVTPTGPRVDADTVWRDRNALVIGASGFLGSHVVWKLQRAGARVSGLVSPRSSSEVLAERRLAERMKVWVGDVRDGELLRRIIDEDAIDTCIHVAGIATVGSVAMDPLTAFEINIKGTWVGVDAFRNSSVKAFVCASSDKAYGDHGGAPVTEDAPLRAKNAYDVTKACADLLVRSYASQYGLPTVIARVSNIYGPADLSHRIIPYNVQQILRGQPPTVVDGTQHYIREFVYISDAADALILLAERAGEVAGEAFNVGSGSISMADLMDTLLRSLDSELKPKILPQRPGIKEIPCVRINSTKLLGLGWRPRYTLEEGLRATIAWHRRLVESGRFPPIYDA